MPPPPRVGGWAQGLTLGGGQGVGAGSAGAGVIRPAVALPPRLPPQNQQPAYVHPPGGLLPRPPPEYETAAFIATAWACANFQKGTIPETPPPLRA